MTLTLEDMLRMQHRLQVDSFKKNPCTMTGDERAEFIRWNTLALTDELHEALAEVGWKPWASSRHLNREAYIKELVDAWHFFMNLLLASGLLPDEAALAFEDEYIRKNKVNADRQADGYDGLKMKCPSCKRDLHDFEYIAGECGPVWVGTVDSERPHLETCITEPSYDC